MHRSRNKTVREKIKPISNYVLFMCYDLNRNLKASIVWLMFSCDYLSRPSPIHHLKHFVFLEEDLLSASYPTRNHSMQAFQTTAVIAPTDQARVSHQNHGRAHPQSPKIEPQGGTGTAWLKRRGLELWLLGRFARDLDYIYLIINLSIFYCDLILKPKMARSSWGGQLDVAALLWPACSMAPTEKYPLQKLIEWRLVLHLPHQNLKVLA